MPTVIADGVYYVDLGADPDFTPGSFISVYPENCTFDHAIKGIGNISFQLSFSATDQDGNPAVSGLDFIGPYRDYWRLRYGNVAILAGVIVSSHSKKGSDYMDIAGKTWEHIFELMQYPFDPRTTERVPGDPSSAPVNDYVHPNTYQNDELTGSGSATPEGLVYQAVNRDLIRIWSDLFTTSMNVPNRITFDVSDLAGLSGIKAPSYVFSLGDTSTMMDVANGLSEIENGFDWWVGYDRQIHWGSPYRFGNPSAPFSFATVDDTWADNGYLIEADFTNDGPNATHVLGRGAGLASQTTLARAYGYTPAQTQFFRIDRMYDFGDVRNASVMVMRTQKQLSRDLQPKHTIPLSFDPGLISGFWANFRTGRAIYLNLDFVYHTVDSYQQLVSYTATLDENGNARANFALEQIYDLSVNAGSPEG